jgi:hypothetical protein
MGRFTRGFPQFLIGACGAWALTGCGRGDDAAGVHRHEVSRKMVEVAWRERWLAGGGEGDTTVLMPSYLVGDGRLVYALETQFHRVVALRAEDGVVVWRAGGEGSGPQELRNPTAITLDPHGNVLVVDQGNGRLAILAPTGIFVAHVALQELGFPHGLCALGDGSVLVTAVATEHPLVRVSTRGRVTQRYELPWKDLIGAGSLSIQGDLESDGDGGCIYALSKGRGFVRFRDGRLTPHDYVEWFDVPRSERVGDPYAGGRRETLAEGPIAAQGLGVGKEGIAVGFSGRTNEAGRLIDFYDGNTGAYTHSYASPRWFQRMSRAGNLYLFITRVDGYPAVLAAEPVVEPAAP